MSEFNSPRYLVDRSEPSGVFLKARNLAGTVLQEMMGKVAGGGVDAKDDFKWIKHELTHPSFDDLTFAYNNQVLSVVIELIDGENSLLSQQDRDRFSAATTEHNLVACLFKIQLDSMQPLFSDWNLVGLDSQNQIIPEELVITEKIVMSEWELRNFSIQVSRNHITQEKSFKLLSFCSELHIDPQIWFEDTNGKKNWVIVRCSNLNASDDEEHKKWMGFEESNPLLKEYDGFYAGVSFASMAPVLLDTEGNIIPPSERFNGKAPLYRGDEFGIKFTGLKRIYVS
ncbi:MAG: hypothetical protein MK183_07980 [Verrucomicrobiales bacterium]|jgi:hypothetical protein|nr:hypothetical protein [Verrucomicrobiales bacterium]